MIDPDYQWGFWSWATTILVGKVYYCCDDHTTHLTTHRSTSAGSLCSRRLSLLQVGRSQIFLVSPDTKKVAIEKSFREISFCSQVSSSVSPHNGLCGHVWYAKSLLYQGIRHVDHFGFICRETVEGGSCHFVCYVFQCTDESLVRGRLWEQTMLDYGKKRMGRLLPLLLGFSFSPHVSLSWKKKLEGISLNLA